MAAGAELENGRVVLWWLRSPGGDQGGASGVSIRVARPLRAARYF